MLVLFIKIKFCMKPIIIIENNHVLATKLEVCNEKLD